MKWTWQRCPVALSTFETAALMPSCAPKITSLTPRRPRRVSSRRNSVQIGSLRSAYFQTLAATIDVRPHGDDA